MGRLGRFGKQFSAVALAGLIAIAAASGAAAQNGAAQPGTPVAAMATSGPAVVVTGWGMASAPADGAIVQLLARQLGVADSGTGSGGSGGPTGIPTPPKKNQIDAITAALVKAGIAQDKIATAIVPEGPYTTTFGQGVDVIAFQLDAARFNKLTKYLDAARKSATEAGVSFDAINLVYTVNNCDALANASMAAAIKNGHDQAVVLAPALGKTLGDLVQASALSSYGKFYAGGYGGNYCSQPMTLAGALTMYFSSYDPTMKAEVVVYSSISLTYALI